MSEKLCLFIKKKNLDNINEQNNLVRMWKVYKAKCAHKAEDLMKMWV